MRSLFQWPAVLVIAAAVFCAAVPGCGGPSGLEKPAENVDLKPDMNKMPGFNEMQEKLKTEKHKK